MLNIAGTLTLANIAAGDLWTNSLTINNGGTATNSGITLGWATGSTAAELDYVTLNGGLLQMSGNLAGATVAANQTRSVNWNGGTLQARANLTVGPNLTNFVQTGGAVIDTLGNTVTVSAPMVNGTGGSTDGGLTKLGTGTLIIASTNTYTGSTTISNGAVSINNNSTLGTGLLTLAGGTLSNTISTTLTNAVNVSANSTVSVVLTNTLTLGGVITNTGNLTVTGPGTLMLTNVNPYTGTTLVNGGTFVSQQPVVGPVSVAGGTLAPGGVTNVGTLTLRTNLTTATSALLAFDITGTNAGGYDQILAAGTNFGPGIIQLNPTTGIVSNGVYTLMTYSNRSGGVYVFPNGTTNMGNLTLTNGPTSLTLGTAGGNVGLTNLIWRGTNTIWDKGITYNWLNNGTAATYQDGVNVNVTFDDTAATGTVAGTNLAPGSVIFNNNATNYTISATTNTIGGTAAVTKLGAGMVTFAGTNLFSGGLNILNGMVAGAVTNSFGTGIITLGDSSGSASATLSNSAAVSTFTIIANPIVVTAGSSGNLSILANNAYTTNTGTLTLNNNLTVGSGNTGKQMSFNGPLTNTTTSVVTITNQTTSLGQFVGPISVGASSGSGLTLVNNSTVAETIGAATTTVTGSGALTFNANNTGAFTVNATNINNSGSLTNSGTGTGTTTISGIISNNVVNVVQNSAGSLLKLGAAATFTNYFTGSLYVLAGTVQDVFGGVPGFPFGTNTIYLGATSGSANATLAGAMNGTIDTLGVFNLGYTNSIVVQAGSTGVLYQLRK